MNFTEQNAQSTLPQFSEISARTTASAYISTGSDPLLSSNHNAVYTTAADSNNVKQILINTQNSKYQNTILNLSEPNAFIQFCEKPNLQTLNIPAYSQNSAVLNVQSQILPMKIIQNVQLAQDDKNDAQQLKNGSNDANNDHLISQPNLMIEYLQNISRSSTLQQIMKMQEQAVKKEKEEPKNDQIQSNILNIPSVQIYKTAQILNDISYMDDSTLLTLKPLLAQNDVNVHLENHSENHNDMETQTPPQNDKTVQRAEADNSKPAKKTQFRAKMGEIKVSLAIDGSPMYHCPECSSTFPQKSEIDEHMQKHLLERKFKCLDCGAMLKRKEHLDQHIRGHSNARPYTCNVCKKAFKRNEHLTRHFVTHSGNKNFLCQICNKAFSRKDHLSKHTQTHLGIRKSKAKKVPTSVPNDVNAMMNTTSASPVATTMLLNRPEINSFLKDGVIKQEAKSQHLIQQIQNMQDNKLMLSLWQEQIFKEGMQQAVSMNEILPQNTRYSAPT